METQILFAVGFSGTSWSPPGFMIPFRVRPAHAHWLITQEANGIWRGWRKNGCQAATDALTKLGSDALPVVRRGLHEEDLKGRVLPAIVCGKLRDSGSARALGECLRQTGGEPYGRYVDEQVEYARWQYILQEACVEALIEIGPEAGTVLVQTCPELDPQVRAEIMEMMATEWGKAALPYLIELRNDKSHPPRLNR